MEKDKEEDIIDDVFKCDILSQNEIDQLLTAFSTPSEEGEEDAYNSFYKNVRKIKIYDFKRLDKFSKEQIRSITMIHETFVRKATEYLSRQFRKDVHCHVASVDQLSYEEFICSIPIPTLLGIINMEETGGTACIEIDPSVYSAMLNKIFGGPGDINGFVHRKDITLTALENFTMQKPVIGLLECFRSAWEPFAVIKPKLSHIETNPTFVQLVPPNEMVILIDIEIEFCGVEGMINICIPYLSLESILDELTRKNWYSTGGTSKQRQRINPESLRNVKMSANAILFEKEILYSELSEWKPGTIIYPYENLDPNQYTLCIDGIQLFTARILKTNPVFNKKIIIEKQCDFKEVGIMKKNVNYATAKNREEAMGQMKIQCIVELGRTELTMEELLSMSEGRILTLEKLAGEPIDIFANNVLVAHGEVVVIDENLGVRVTNCVMGKTSESNPIKQQDESSGENPDEDPFYLGPLCTIR